MTGPTLNKNKSMSLPNPASISFWSNKSTTRIGVAPAVPLASCFRSAGPGHISWNRQSPFGATPSWTSIRTQDSPRASPTLYPPPLNVQHPAVSITTVSVRGFNNFRRAKRSYYNIVSALLRYYLLVTSQQRVESPF